MPSPATPRADVVLAGGGLANGLIALRLKALRPDLRVVMLERNGVVGGVHTWCHFASDVSPEIEAWLAPLTAHRWDDYEVRFPAHARRLTTVYSAIPSDRLHTAVSEALGADLHLNAAITEVTPQAVTLADGRRFEGGAVIDGRGARASEQLALGWQKFLGLEIELSVPHRLARPIVMDSTVDQLDGYRFVYVLPLSPTRLLIEDTRYSDGDDLDRKSLRAAIATYAAEHGWPIREIVREEDGILPIALGGDIEAFWREADAGVAQTGLRAALFQPTTGYSLPDAARMADAVAALPELTSASVRALTETTSVAAWRERAFYRLLNRMLFRACAPNRRYIVLERFYRLRQPLVERFYASRANLADKARVLIGKPPVPVGAAMAVLPQSSVFKGATA